MTLQNDRAFPSDRAGQLGLSFVAYAAARLMPIALQRVYQLEDRGEVKLEQGQRSICAADAAVEHAMALEARLGKVGAL
jgi:hypothetical protein